MRRVLCAVLLCCCLVCPARAETVIRYWVNDRHDADFMTSVIDQFNAENTSGIRVEMRIIPSDFERQVSLAYYSGSAPDIIGQSITLRTFAENGMLLPLNDFIDADEDYLRVNEPYDHAIENLNALNGQLYWVPSGTRSGVRVIYNKDLLERCGETEIPATLSDFIDLAGRITSLGAGKFWGIGFTSDSPFERLLEMCAQVSGIYYYDYTNGRFDFSGYAPVLEEGRRFFTENIAYPESLSVDNMRSLFTQGMFALWGNASQEAAVFTRQLPIEDFEWGVAPVPSLTGEIQGALQLTYTKGYAILSSTAHPDAAWEVIRYLQSEEVLKNYLEQGYCLPLSSCMASAVDSAETGRLADFALLPYESVYPAVPEIDLSGASYREVFWQAVTGEIGIEEAIADLNQRYNAALDADLTAGSVRRLIIPDYDPMDPDGGTPEYLSE